MRFTGFHAVGLKFFTVFFTGVWRRPVMSADWAGGVGAAGRFVTSAASAAGDSSTPTGR